MPNINLTPILLIATVLVLLPSVHAFGAGEVPDFSYLHDKAFRHGDLEATLEELAKTAGGGGGGHGLLGAAMGILASAAGGAKFTKRDIKKVYFGNWLRDYSQAMDIAGLSKLTGNSIVLVLSVLSFMTFGFATEEFELTAERLGVYLPIEHIDNPKGYAEKEGDARQFHAKLRPPVDPRELEIDERNGMKNYIATEGRGWETSSAHVRRTLEACIQRGRASRGQDGPDRYEAYRLLGTALHTLEDLLAHSNWVELSLTKMGHKNVFCHVGDNVKVNSPQGQVPPLVTGTFGSADFIHSVLGEATDKLSSASLTDVSSKLTSAQNKQDGGSALDGIKALLSQLPSGSANNEKLQQAEDIKKSALNLNPDQVATEEVQKQFWALIVWRDGVMRDVIKAIENIPGLDTLVEQLTEALNVYVYTVLQPYLTPILGQVTSTLGDGSKAVIDCDDQYEVFNNPNASDPSHSLLSKDHFNNILNAPAGKVAIVVVAHTVTAVVQAWDNPNQDVRSTIDQVLEALHHPYYATGNSRVQTEMSRALDAWFRNLSREDQAETIRRITKESVREGKNKRLGVDDNEPMHGHAHGATVSGGRPQQQGSGRPSGQVHGGGSGQYGGGGYGAKPSSGYGGGRDEHGSGGGYGGSHGGGGYGQQGSGYGGQQSSGYGQQGAGYGGQQGSGHGKQGGGYGSSGGTYGESGGYGSKPSSGHGGEYGRDEYGSSKPTSGGGYGGYGGQQTHQSSGYGGQAHQGSGYGSGQTTGQSHGYGGTTGYGRDDSKTSEGYGGQQGYGRQEGGVSGGTTGGYGSYGRESSPPSHQKKKKSEDDDERRTGYGGGGYGDSGSYGHKKKKSEDEERRPGYGGGYGGSGGGYGKSGKDEYSGGGGYGESHRKKDSDDEGRGGYGHQKKPSDDKGYGGYGGGYGESHKKSDDTTGYGGYGEHRKKVRDSSPKSSDDEKKSHHKSKKRDDDDGDHRGGYGGGGGGGGYGGSHKKVRDSSPPSPKEKKSHKKKKSEDSDDERRGGAGGYGGYGKKVRDSGPPSPKEKKSHKKKKSEDSDDERRGGYGGGNTYGVERMNIRDDDDDKHGGYGKHHGGKREYGGDRY